MIEEAEAIIERLKYIDRRGNWNAAMPKSPHPVCTEAAALIRRLVDGLKGQGECICPKCGIRHGGSHFPRGDF